MGIDEQKNALAGFHPSKEGFKDLLGLIDTTGLNRFHPSKEGFKELENGTLKRGRPVFPSL